MPSADSRQSGPICPSTINEPQDKQCPSSNQKKPQDSPHCHGYILASQHPAFAYDPSDPIDPYAVIACPFQPCAPNVLSDKCAGRLPSSDGIDNAHQARAAKEVEQVGKKVRSGCARGRWCVQHFCGGCRKLNAVPPLAAGARRVAQPGPDCDQQANANRDAVVQDAPRPDTPIPSAGLLDPVTDYGTEGGDGKTAGFSHDDAIRMEEDDDAEPAHEIRL